MALLIVAVVGMALLLYVVVRRGGRTANRSDTSSPSSDREPSADPGRPRLDRRFLPSRPTTTARRSTQDGRRHAPSRPARIRNRPIPDGEIPLTPPRFADRGQRARFKAWWVTEFKRRMRVYQRLEPGRSYPPPEEADRLLEDYYDAAEPRAPDESVDAALKRHHQRQALWQQFLNQYGATVKTVVSRGGDPQYGATPKPPVDPPGTTQTKPPAAEPAPQVPPGATPGSPPPAGDSDSPPPAPEEGEAMGRTR